MAQNPLIVQAPVAISDWTYAHCGTYKGFQGIFKEYAMMLVQGSSDAGFTRGKWGVGPRTRCL